MTPNEARDTASLARLDGYPLDSYCTITLPVGEGPPSLSTQATSNLSEEDPNNNHKQPNPR
jgi:hypothetical protein